MSKEKKETIKCPDCGKEGTYTLHESINVTLDPDMKEKVLKGEAFKYTCPSCNKEMVINYSFLYHDMKKGYMIYELLADESIEELNSSNEYKDFIKNYKLRVVRNHNKLIEKIHIFDDNLNDIIIESIKVLILNKAPKEDLGKIQNIFYDGKDENKIYYVVFFSDNTVKSCDVPLSAYEQIKKGAGNPLPKGFAEVNETNFEEYIKKNK